MRFYGEPDSFYDSGKCSFNYTFVFKVSFKKDAPQKEVYLLMRLQDYKGYPDIEFRRPMEGPKDNALKSMEHVIKGRDLLRFYFVILAYFCAFYKNNDYTYPEFERVQPYFNYVYGYKDGKFFKYRVRDVEHGRLKATREVIVNYLVITFGQESSALQARVGELSDPEIASRVFSELLSVNSLDGANRIMIEALATSRSSGFGRIDTGG